MLATPKNLSFCWNSLWHASSCLQPISIWKGDSQTYKLIYLDGRSKIPNLHDFSILSFLVQVAVKLLILTVGKLTTWLTIGIWSVPTMPTRKTIDMLRISQCWVQLLPWWWTMNIEKSRITKWGIYRIFMATRGHTSSFFNYRWVKYKIKLIFVRLHFFDLTPLILFWFRGLPFLSLFNITKLVQIRFGLFTEKFSMDY